MTPAPRHPPFRLPRLQSTSIDCLRLQSGLFSLLLVLFLATTTTFAADPAPDWQPSPDMTGTFHSLLGDDLFIVEPNGHCELSTTSEWAHGMEFHAVGPLRPNPAGESNRFLADLACDNPDPVLEDFPATMTFGFSFTPADRAWQLLSVNDGNSCVVSLEEESSMTVDGGVEHDDTWFLWRFVPDPASFDWATAPDSARRHFMGTWKNLADGDDGAIIVLSPDGSGTIENKNLAAPTTCKWSVVRHDNGWHVICETNDSSSPSVPTEPFFAVLEPDDQFQRLRLVNVTHYRGLAMASNYHESLPDSNPTCFDRIADPPPAAPPAP